METVPFHCQFVVLRSKQCRLWLTRPMREWQSLPHEEQMPIDAAELVVVFSFRLALFAMASLVIFSSPSFSCLRMRQRQLLRSPAMSSQLSGSISKSGSLIQGHLDHGASKEQGWRCGESTRLPPMRLGIDSQTRHHMWVEFVVGSLLCSRGFSPGTPVFPSPQKPTFPNSNLIRIFQWSNSHSVEVPLNSH